MLKFKARPIHRSFDVRSFVRSPATRPASGSPVITPTGTLRMECPANRKLENPGESPMLINNGRSKNHCRHPTPLRNERCEVVEFVRRLPNAETVARWRKPSTPRNWSGLIRPRTSSKNWLWNSAGGPGDISFLSIFRYWFDATADHFTYPYVNNA